MQTKDVFISYGRKESLAFARKLYQKLADNGLDAWFDFVNIPKGDDYQKRIDNGIESADNFIYIISPHANASEFCLLEVELALSLGKRIIPIMHIERGKELVHPAIGKLNWVMAKEKEETGKPLEEWTPIDDFDKAFTELLGIIGTEKEYVSRHTSILLKALEWQRGLKETKYLLVGNERQEAEAWLLREFIAPEQPPCSPNTHHGEYICASRKNGENLMTDCFICYDAQDKPLRDQVIRSLERRAVTVWTHDKDIVKGKTSDVAIEEGIEQADNLLFFISPLSVRSEYCIKEIRHALSLNKRIIPLLIAPTPTADLPKEIAGLQYIDFTDNLNATDYYKDIEDILAVLRADRRYHEQHKVFLVQALKWRAQAKNPSILLRGYNLQNAQTWLKLGLARDMHRPTALHEAFVQESAAQSGEQQVEVFLSYSRKDGDFARKLNAELQLNGKTTWFDQDSIAVGADFQQEIYKGIAQSDNFVFIISPDAVNSEFCADEVAYAAKLNKRFITLHYREVAVGTMPPALAAVQWIDFKADFHTAFSMMVRTLDTDREHVQSTPNGRTVPSNGKPRAKATICSCGAASSPWRSYG